LVHEIGLKVRVEIGSNWGSNQRIDIHTLPPSIKYDHKILVIQFHGVLLQDSMLTPEYEKKSGKNIRVIIETKSEMKLPT